MGDRNIILQEAKDLLNKYNEEDFTLERLAAETKSKPEEIKKHFSDREELLNTVLKRELNKKLKLIGKIKKKDIHLQEKLIFLLDKHFAYLKHNRAIAEILVKQTMLPGENALPAVDYFIEHFPVKLAEIIDIAIRRGEVRKVDSLLVAKAMLHSIHGVTLKATYDPAYSYPQAKKELVNLFCIGINK